VALLNAACAPISSNPVFGGEGDVSGYPAKQAVSAQPKNAVHA